MCWSMVYGCRSTPGLPRPPRPNTTAAQPALTVLRTRGVTAVMSVSMADMKAKSWPCAACSTLVEKRERRCG